MNDFPIATRPNPVNPIGDEWSCALRNFDRVLTGLNFLNERLTRLKFPSHTQSKSHIYSTETLAVLFDMALCISDRHSAALLCIV